MNELRKFKDESGMKMAKMKQVTGISIQSLSSIMSKSPEGLRKIKVETLLTIFDKLGVNLISNTHTINKK